MYRVNDYSTFPKGKIKMIAKKYPAHTRNKWGRIIETLYIREHVNWHVMVREIDSKNCTVECIYPDLGSSISDIRKSIKWSIEYLKTNKSYVLDIDIDTFALMSEDKFIWSEDHTDAIDFRSLDDLESIIEKYPRLEDRLRKEWASISRLTKKLGLKKNDNGAWILE